MPQFWVPAWAWDGMIVEPRCAICDKVRTTAARSFWRRVSNLTEEHPNGVSPLARR